MLVIKSFTIKSWCNVASRSSTSSYNVTQPNTVTFKYLPNNNQEEVVKALFRVEGIGKDFEQYIPKVAKAIKTGIEQASDKMSRSIDIINADIFAGEYSLEIDSIYDDRLHFTVTIQYATN